MIKLGFPPKFAVIGNFSKPEAFCIFSRIFHVKITTNARPTYILPGETKYGVSIYNQ